MLLHATARSRAKEILGFSPSDEEVLKKAVSQTDLVFLERSFKNPDMVSADELQSQLAFVGAKNIFRKDFRNG